MTMETFPDELIHHIVVDVQLSALADKKFYVSRRQAAEREPGLYWTHSHLVSFSAVNKQFRRVCLPILFNSVDVAVRCYDGDEFKPFLEDLKRSAGLASLRRDISALVKRMNIIRIQHYCYPDGYDYCALISVLNSFPNLKVLSGLELSHPSEKLIMAINDSPLPSFDIYVSFYMPVPVERLRSNPDILRKICIQKYDISHAGDIDWLKAACSVCIYDLVFSLFDLGSSFLDQLPVFPSLESINVRIHNNYLDEAAEVVEKLQSYLQGPGRSVTRVSFEAYYDENPKGFDLIPGMPLIGSLWDAFGSAEIAGQGITMRLQEYEISLTSQWPGDNNDWEAWKITSLRISSYPLDLEILQILSEQAPFLEVLDIRHLDQVEQQEQWGLALLSPERSVTIFRPFKFLRFLLLPRIRLAVADLNSKLVWKRKTRFGHKALDIPHAELAESATLLLEALCKALGQELKLLKYVTLQVDAGKRRTSTLNANLRRRISREGPWVEVDISCKGY